MALIPHRQRGHALSVLEGGGGEGVIAREIVASRVQAPPVFCTEAKVAKGGGGVFTGHYGTGNYILARPSPLVLHVSLCKRLPLSIVLNSTWSDMCAILFTPELYVKSTLCIHTSDITLCQL